MSSLVDFLVREIQRLKRGNLRAALHHSLRHFWRGDAHEKLRKPGVKRLL